MTDAILCGCTVCGKDFAASPHKSNKYCGMACYRAAQRAGSYKRGHGPEFHRAPCHHCGVTVERNPSTTRSGQQSDKVFCARSCYDASRALAAKGRNRQCDNCRSEFTPRKSDTKYCSMDCRRVGMKADPRHCLSCECFFTPVRQQKATGRYISYSAGKTCSASCHLAWIRDNPERKRKIGDAFRGEKHPNWQGGKSILNNTSSRGPNWQKQRMAALERDGHACVDCGMTDDQSRQVYGRSLDVDHNVPYHNFSSYRAANKIGNLSSRCASCHRIAEAKRGMVQMVLPMQDSAKRMHKGYCKGERINTAKLTELDVRRIRARAASGENEGVIHMDYSQVGRGAVSAIINRKTWRHVA